MTEDEMVAIIKDALGEWEKTLGDKILGPINPYRLGATVLAKAEFNGTLDSIDEETLRPKISDVFQQLASAHAFHISEPDPRSLHLAPTPKTVMSGSLNLTYLLGGEDVATLEHDLNVLACWFQPS